MFLGQGGSGADGEQHDLVDVLKVPFAFDTM